MSNTNRDPLIVCPVSRTVLPAHRYTRYQRSRPRGPVDPDAPGSVTLGVQLSYRPQTLNGTEVRAWLSQANPGCVRSSRSERACASEGARPA